MKRSGEVVLSLGTIIAYLVMVGMNALANVLPINGITTGEVSDLYGNLFAPAGITFSIWGLIYLLLGAYCIYQFKYIKNKDKKWRLLNGINLLFLFTSIINSIWIVFWHYSLIGSTLILMILLLISLILIRLFAREVPVSTSNFLFITLPFSVYFGWVSVATIANVTAYLVKTQWGGFGLSPVIWTVFILITGLAIGALTTIFFKDKAYGLVFIWAYLGITIKHISESGFDFQYPSIVIAAILSMIVLSYVVIFKTKNSYT